MRIAIALLLSVGLFFTATAQDYTFKDFSWEEEFDYKKPVVPEGEHELYVKNDYRLEYVLEENVGFFQYELTHQIVYVATDEGVKRNNTFYLYTNEYGEIISQKVRVINKNGKIRELKEEDILEATDEESGTQYNYFALEGLEVGAFIEFLLIEKNYADYNGAQYFIQENLHQYNVNFELICPRFLEFDFQVYNYDAELEPDTAFADKYNWQLKIDTLGKLKEEAMAANYANRVRVVYKLRKNYAANLFDLNSYGLAAQDIYKIMYTEVDKKGKKVVDAVLKDADVPKKGTDLEKFRVLEDYIKRNFNFVGYVKPEFDNLKSFYEYKTITSDGATRLFANALKSLEIKHQLVYTSDRFSLPFDRDFEAYNFLEIALIYLPEHELFLAPTIQTLRLGYVPVSYASTLGLFIKEFTLGGNKTGLGIIDSIPAMPYDYNSNTMLVKADLTQAGSEPTYNYEIKIKGYDSAPVQAFYDLIGEKEQEDIRDGLKAFVTDEEIEFDVEVTNTESRFIGVEPLIITTNFKTNAFTQTAGDKMLLNIGKLIGPQFELYNEDTRVQDVELDNNKVYDRTIEVKIPEGYTLAGLEKLNFDVKTSDESAVFKSTYELNGNTLTVSIDEFYKRIHYPVEMYDEYAEVINAAADFNKVTLVLKQ